MEINADFSKIKVLIVGDAMIDRYWWGSVERISPEAPVPVVRLQQATLVAGGAANVAANVCGLGAQPILVSIVGDDEEAAQLTNLLDSTGITSEFVTKIEARPTTVKTRIIAHNQQVARIDKESNSRIGEKEEEKIWLKISKLIGQTNVVIVSDYAKGLLTETLLKRLITKCNKENKVVLVDPKGKDFSKYKNADIITPNERETAEACGMELDGCQSIKKAATKILFDLNLKAVLVTRGEAGMMLLEGSEKILFLEAVARDVYDVTGAGDTVIAALAVFIAAGSNFADAARLANAAAGLAVEQVGTTTVKIEDLRRAAKRIETAEK